MELILFEHNFFKRHIVLLVITGCRAKIIPITLAGSCFMLTYG